MSNDTTQYHQGTGSRSPVKAAVISPDPAFREALTSILASRDIGVHLALEIDMPLTEVADPELDQLRRTAPGIVFLDLEENPHVGLKFAEFLVESSLATALIGAGASASPELLLSAMQAGVSEFLTKPVTPEAVVSAGLGDEPHEGLLLHPRAGASGGERRGVGRADLAQGRNTLRLAKRPLPGGTVRSVVRDHLDRLHRAGIGAFFTAGAKIQRRLIVPTFVGQAVR